MTPWNNTSRIYRGTIWYCSKRSKYTSAHILKNRKLYSKGKFWNKLYWDVRWYLLTLRKRRMGLDTYRGWKYRSCNWMSFYDRNYRSYHVSRSLICNRSKCLTQSNSFCTTRTRRKIMKSCILVRNDSYWRYWFLAGTWTLLWSSRSKRNTWNY